MFTIQNGRFNEAICFNRPSGFGFEDEGTVVFAIKD
jgi:hypothetical protein